MTVIKDTTTLSGIAVMTITAEAMAIAPAGQNGMTTIKNMGKNAEAETAMSIGTLKTHTGKDLTALTMITIGATKTVVLKKKQEGQWKGVKGPRRQTVGNRWTKTRLMLRLTSLLQNWRRGP